MNGTSTSYRIERLRWWHLRHIAHLEKLIFGAEAWTDGMLWAELAAGHYYRVALPSRPEPGAQDEVLAYAGLALVPPEEAWINNIAVAPAARGRGIARALLEDLLSHARDQGIQSVLLEVAVDNMPAQILYDSFGFDTVGIRKGYYQPSNTDAAVMRMELQ
ncbi:ribosomal protein S18-alanine N-acetyltransferase [Natronoglycomyces albus]|uniref:Ribosomal protein S18-alanine N-acetyltransferase n=1 Tax=Natronoglycomyces albus TaxID=2811108 RepID=A0A895XVY9_9ACTN|nr:ribosomal protein S18-alanine N-acetyltransferase [Natronoglycomyces albus]QSB05798.1 ribosomal protein S18-alanine N-acetyltransferase [Natronoglycomyces albus]